MSISDKNLSLFDRPDSTESDPLFHESIESDRGFRFIAGVDEVGRGPLAGPVAAAAVIMPEGVRLPGIKDSKKMTERARNRAFSVIVENAVSIGIGVVSQRYIDDHNILRASLEAMRLAVSYLKPSPDFLMIDGIYPVSSPIPQKCIIKGDLLSQSISAASIIAKVYRDNIMNSYHEHYPLYDFQKNKGYGTAAHMRALREHGPCPFHRLSFRGVVT